jgi:hypothetical protein
MKDCSMFLSDRMNGCGVENPVANPLDGTGIERAANGSREFALFSRRWDTLLDRRDGQKVAEQIANHRRRCQAALMSDRFQFRDLPSRQEKG